MGQRMEPAFVSGVTFLRVISYTLYCVQLSDITLSCCLPWTNFIAVTFVRIFLTTLSYLLSVSSIPNATAKDCRVGS